MKASWKAKRNSAEKLFVLFEQAASSIFNFSVIVLLSREQLSSVGIYGVGFAIYLFVAGFFKNAVTNPMLVSGNRNSELFLNALVSVFKRRMFIFFIVLLLVYIVYTSTFSAISITLVFLFMEFSRSLYLANRDMFMFFGFSLVFYIATMLLVLTLQFDIAFTITAVTSIGWFIFSVGRFNSKERVEFDITRSDQSILLTTSYFCMTSAPLLALQASNPLFAALFVQVRSLFQPLMLLSRVSDLLDKRSASCHDSFDFSLLIRRVALFGVVALPASMTVWLICHFLFELIYDSYYEGISVLAMLFAITIFIIFVTRPIETFYFKNMLLRKLTLIRVFSASLCLAILLVPIFSEKTLSLNLSLFSMLASWIILLVVSVAYLRYLKKRLILGRSVL